MIDDKTKTFLATIAYKLFQLVRQTFWHISGGRKEVVFGEQFSFAPLTHFPSFRGLRFPVREVLSTIVRYGDYVQTHSAYLYLAELKNPPIVVDVGAHHGVYAILLGKLVQQKRGKVIAVEPNPRAFKILQENVRMNNLEDTVKCESAAIMGRSGTFQFTDNEDQSRIVESIDPAAFKVEAMPLSSLLKKYSLATVDIMIIDVEGAELNVLRSINWKECRFGRIFCELHPYNWKHFGYSGIDMSEFLRQHNFRCFDMYLREHKEFMSDVYIGPTLLVSDNDR
jgi:methyltransferase, FkbM family